MTNQDNKPSTQDELRAAFEQWKLTLDEDHNARTGYEFGDSFSREGFEAGAQWQASRQAGPSCGACPGDGTICATECRLASESPPIAPTDLQAAILALPLPEHCGASNIVNYYSEQQMRDLRTAAAELVAGVSLANCLRAIHAGLGLPEGDQVELQAILMAIHDLRTSPVQTAVAVPGLGRMTNDEDGYITLQFKDENYAQEFMSGHSPTIDVRDMPEIRDDLRPPVVDVSIATGTFNCPICGYDKPHGHSDEDIRAYRSDQIRADGWRSSPTFTPKESGWYLCRGVTLREQKYNASQFWWFEWVRKHAARGDSDIPEVLYFDKTCGSWSIRNALGNASISGAESRIFVFADVELWREIPQSTTLAAKPSEPKP